MSLIFEWDPKKARLNLRKHRVSFTEAQTIFGDPLELMIPDPDHGAEEERSISIGESGGGMLLLVSYTQIENVIRLISARKAETELLNIARNVVPMMRKNYDLSNAIQGSHFKQYREGHSILLIDDDVVAPSPAKRKNDTQLTELAGRFALISQLTKDGLEVALPMRDRGVDLIAYTDLDEQGAAFLACPIQLKVNTGKRFGLDKKYEKIRNFLLVYVWNVNSAGEEQTYALTYHEAEQLLKQRGYDAVACWKEKGVHSVASPDKLLIELLEPYRMSPGKWKARVQQALQEVLPQSA